MHILQPGPPAAPGQRMRHGVTAEGTCATTGILGWRDVTPRAGLFRLRLDASSLPAATETEIETEYEATPCGFGGCLRESGRD